MKRCGILLLMMTLLFSVARAEAWLTLAQVAETAPDRWTQTCQTPWRQIAIDTPVFVPEASSAPLLSVVWDLREPVSTGRWLALRNARGTLSIRAGDIDAQRPKTPFASAQYYPPYEDVSFSPGNAGDVSRALAEAQQMLRDCGLPDVSLDWQRPAEAAVWWFEGRWGRHVEYTLTLRQTLCGIPLLDHASCAFADVMADDEYSADPGMTLRYLNAEHITLLGRHLRERSLLEADLPLCSFAAVQATLEAEIMAGHIRRIDEVALGYVLYNMPGATRAPGISMRAEAVFYAVPTWRVVCIYVEDPASAWSPARDEAQPARSDGHAACLLVNAQTGELLRWEKSQGRGAADLRDLWTWEEVQ